MGSSHRAQHTKVTSFKVEGNILEYPLFFFGDYRKPTKKSYVFEDEEVGGRLVRRTFSVSNGYGLPGAVAQDCLVGLLMLREAQRDRDVHFYVKRIAKLYVGEKESPNRRRQERVKENLLRLCKTMVEFRDSFFDKEKGEYISTEVQPLFQRARLYEHRPNQNQMKAWKENVFRLSELFERNLEAKYFNWVIFEKYKSLPSGLPRRLFLYLTKKSDGGRRRDFTIRVEKLYPRLPITSKRPAERYEYLERAAKDLEKVGITYRYDNAGKITFTFPPKFEKIVNAPKVDPKTLEDLVVRFYRAVGRDRLSERRLEEGRKILMEIQAEAGVGAERLGQVVDWVLDRRETKFKNLHSIRLLEKAWDQALSAIVREEKKKAGAIARAKEEAAARQAAAERDAARASEIAALRAGLGATEREDVRREAEKRFAQDRTYVFCGQDLAHVADPRERERRREQYLGMIEETILRERSGAGLLARS